MTVPFTGTYILEGSLYAQFRWNTAVPLVVGFWSSNLGTWAAWTALGQGPGGVGDNTSNIGATIARAHSTQFSAGEALQWIAYTPGRTNQVWLDQPELRLTPCWVV
jgi:hypothetical protein